MTHDLWQALTSLEGGKSSVVEARACLAMLWDEVRLRPLYDTCQRHMSWLCYAAAAEFSCQAPVCCAQVKVLVPSLQ